MNAPKQVRDWFSISGNLFSLWTLFAPLLLEHAHHVMAEGQNQISMNFTQTERTTLKRLPKRGVYDRQLVYGILDEGFICHVSFAVYGRPFVIPTGYARVDDQLYIHGSQVSRMLRTLAQGVDVCVAVTLVDGLVLARSAFHHSINYRSVVIFGRAAVVEQREAKL